MPGGSKSSYALKQTCTYDLLLPPDIKWLKFLGQDFLDLSFPFLIFLPLFHIDSCGHCERLRKSVILVL